MRRVAYIQYTNPAAFPPLEHSSKIFAREGWQVLFLGTGGLGTDALKFPTHPAIAVRQLPFCPGGWRQKIHYLWFCLWAMSWAMRWRPTYVYASDPLSCPAVLLLGFVFGLRAIYHEHDSPDMAAVNQSLFIRGVLWARGVLARRAEFCVLPNEHRAERFVVETGTNRKVLCVWNCPMREEAASPRLSCEDDALRILYHGSIVPPRLPTTVLQALTTLPESAKLRIVGYETVGHIGYVRTLQNLAKQLGLEHRVEILGPMSRKELLEQSLRCDVGLSIIPRHGEEVNLKYMIGASVKPFDYLVSGLALLVSDLPDWKKIYVDPGYGLACNPEDPRSIAEALQWFLEHPDDMRAMGERGRQRILSGWNYETQFAPVLERFRLFFKPGERGS